MTSARPAATAATAEPAGGRKPPLVASPRVRKLAPGKRRELKPIHPSVPLRNHYSSRVQVELESMHRSLVYWLTAQWRRSAPEMAQDAGRLTADASPSRELQKLLRRRGRLWRSKFRQLAPKLAEYFATKAQDRVDGALEAMLREHGFTVSFRMTRGLNDVLQATIAEQVNLITNMAEQHIAQVEGAVMRAVQTGHDLHQLTGDLEDIMGISRRRAAFIARDQNNKATATLSKTRHQELGIVEARWLHSSGGRKPRPEHVAFSGKTYQIAKGAFLEGKWTWPGVEINCRCVSVAILPELGE